MRRLLSLLLLMMAADAQSNERNERNEPLTILIFGDSLSAGYGIEIDESWVTLLQSRLEEQGYEHRVVNASISGETTAGGSTRIDAALIEFAPELIILELGGNDGLRGLPTSRMKANLEAIVTSAKASGANVVLLGIRIPTNYGQRYSAAFENVYQRVSEEQDICWVEFFMDGIALNDNLLQDDSIHPNAAAQPRLLDNAWPVIVDSLANSLKESPSAAREE